MATARTDPAPRANPLKQNPRGTTIVRHNTIQLLTYGSLAVSSLVMPLWARELGADSVMIGFIGAAYGVSSFLSNTVFGRAGDRVDRRKLILVGLLISAVGAVLQFLARTPEALLIARFAFGITIGMIPPTLAAYAFDVKRPLGKFTSYNAMGWLLASSLVVATGYIATHAFRQPFLEGMRQRMVDEAGPVPLLFLAAAVFCLVAFLLAWGLRPMRLGLQVRLFPVDVIRRNLHVYLSLFIRHLGAASIWIIYPLYILELGGDLALVGWVHIINMVAQILVYRNVEQLRRLGDAPTLIGIGLALSAVTFFSFTLVNNAYQLLPLQAPLGVSFACLWLGSMKEVMEHNVERATATGLLNASMNLSNVAGPLLGGLIAAAFGFRATMHFAALLTVIAFGVFLVLGRGGRAPVEPTAQGGGPAGDVGPA